MSSINVGFIVIIITSTNEKVKQNATSKLRNTTFVPTNENPNELLKRIMAHHKLLVF